MKETFYLTSLPIVRLASGRDRAWARALVRVGLDTQSPRESELSFHVADLRSPSRGDAGGFTWSSRSAVDGEKGIHAPRHDSRHIQLRQHPVDLGRGHV
ncbi:MAG: hypothetical protein DMF82_06580 [Acidobacteria bacterium]|nr:MAG: hypothetical protein DMF82_06580 [Acidobacteriota bacterium]